MSVRQPRILVVDDDDQIREVLITTLGDGGFEVQLADDGMEALMRLDRQRYHLVITDYVMPRLDGLQLLSICHIVWPELPVMFLSGSDISAVALERGAAAWVKKPFDSVHLLQTVRRVLDKSLKAKGEKQTMLPG